LIARIPRSLFGIGVIETQIAFALVIFCQPEIQTDRLGVANVQISVRFRREAGDDALVLTACKIVIDNRANKIGNRGG
jgi:hypothetical protein